MLAAHAAFALAFTLALGFHRHRAAQLAAIGWLLLAGAAAEAVGVREAALRFAPWLLFGSALLPESRLLSRRHAALVMVVLVLVAVALDAPERLRAMLIAAAAWPLFGLDPWNGAALVCGFATAACLGRWVLRADPLDGALGGAMLLAAIGCGRSAELAWWLAACGATILVGILHASYRMAFVDTLTGLPNRRALDETLQRLSGDYALAMVDVDHFKGFNDRHGHDAGDEVLRTVGDLLRRHAGGRAFRYGGEEFCVVYPGRDGREAMRALDEARARIESNRVTLPATATTKGNPSGRRRNNEVAVTVSGGCAGRNTRRRNAEEVLKAADQALYKAKKAGRNRVVAG